MVLTTERAEVLKITTALFSEIQELGGSVCTMVCKEFGLSPFATAACWGGFALFVLFHVCHAGAPEL